MRRGNERGDGITNLTVRENLGDVLLVAVAVGSLLFLAAYIHSVYLYNARPAPVLYFWVFATIFPIAMAVLWIYRGNTSGFLYLTLGSGLIINALFFFRFYYYSSDLGGELDVAAQTTDLARVPFGLAGNYYHFFNLQTFLLNAPSALLSRYYSTVSVTILPSTISQVTGIPLIDTFRILMPLITMLSAIVVFLIVRLCLGQKVASLSTLFFVFLALTSPLRQAIAYLFFLFAIYYILKGGDRKSVILVIISIALIAPSHYGTFYFSIAVLTLLYLSKKALQLGLFTRIFKNIPRFKLSFSISSTIVIYAAVIGVSWLYFVGFPVFSTNFGSLAGAVSELIHPTVSSLSPFQHHLLSSSLGLYNTAVDWIERGLAIIGVFFLAKKLKTHREYFFLTIVASMLFILGLFAISPTLAKSEDLNRVLGFALLGFATLIATSIFSLGEFEAQSRFRVVRSIPGHLRGPTRGFGFYSAIFAILIIVLTFTAVVNFPILYTSSTDMSTQQYTNTVQNTITFYEQSDFQFDSWLQFHTNQSATFASNEVGSPVLILGNRISFNPVFTNSSQVIPLLEAGRTNYLVIISFLPSVLNYDSGSTGGPTFNGMKLNESQILSISDNSHINRVFDNSRDILLEYVSQHETF